ncbi:flagellar biosynthetic protein FliR [Alkaliphilus metalliredigens QYMF]|uniref:Flagellar biosynthetic protein FliR n=1 Tax=Alkaliphilus metalliredigens (strain QYMF) TaxID=293826 RepID=A6TRN9_ALKMQ|nr:flagellar biosynthetic protein FliR [Alkaliphilus metalliredigens]ABR48857.1 flagellar biosynthetic protein FliR [Alkaliphilus metalliredigens QYMF]
MDDTITQILSNIDIFILLIVRISGIFIIAPIFSRNNIPMMSKIIFSVFLALIILPLVTISEDFAANTFFALMVYAIQEFALGITIGFIGSIYFSTFYLAGMIVDTQIGFGMVNVFDPQMNTQLPIMGNVYNLLISLVFLAVNGHHLLIKAMFDSYDVLPIGFQFQVSEALIMHLTIIFMEIFMMAFKLSAPILATIFLANVLLGILARTMPQMNVFIVGMPLKIIVGLVTIMIALPFLVPFGNALFEKMFTSIDHIIELLFEG